MKWLHRYLAEKEPTLQEFANIVEGLEHVRAEREDNFRLAECGDESLRFAESDC
jgi:hypothetical protein